MYKNKRAEVPWIKLIVILLITSTILITFIIALSQLNHVEINDKKLRTQIIINNLLDSKCFSNKFATIEKNKFTQDNLNLCLSGLEEETLVRVILGSQEFYLNEDDKNTMKNNFDFKKSLCGLNSNILCSKVKYPIIIEDNNKYETEVLTIQIIV